MWLSPSLPGIYLYVPCSCYFYLRCIYIQLTVTIFIQDTFKCGLQLQFYRFLHFAKLLRVSLKNSVFIWRPQSTTRDLPVYEWYFTEEFLGLAKTGTTSIPPGERHTHGHSNNYRQSDNHRRHNHYYSIPSQLHGDIRGNVTLLSLGEVWLSQKLVGR